MSPPRSTVAPGGEPDERRDRGVRARGAEQRPLELGVCGVERLVLPVEAAAALGDRGEEREQDRPEERVVLRRAEPECACAKIAAAGSRRRSSIALRASGSRRSVGAWLVDEPAHERPVLVQRRPVARRMLLERERQLRAALGGEGGEAEGPQATAGDGVPGAQESVRGRAAVSYATPRRSATERPTSPVPASDSDRRAARGSGPGWHAGHQYAVRLASP